MALGSCNPQITKTFGLKILKRNRDAENSECLKTTSIKPWWLRCFVVTKWEARAIGISDSLRFAAKQSFTYHQHNKWQQHSNEQETTILSQETDLQKKLKRDYKRTNSWLSYYAVFTTEEHAPISKHTLHFWFVLWKFFFMNLLIHLPPSKIS